MQIWDYINAMTIEKRELDMSNPEIESGYNIYIINRLLSSIDVYLNIINELNKYVQYMSKQTHYNFLLNLLPKQNIYINYDKIKINKIIDVDIKYIAKYFEIGLSEAKIYKSMLNENDIKLILECYKYGSGQLLGDDEL